MDQNRSGWTGVRCAVVIIGATIGAMNGTTLGGDCNNNGIPDDQDIANGTSQDCNSNGIPDECDVAFGSSADCNGNEIPDECEMDCNDNGVPDDCDLILGDAVDCNGNEVPDVCDIADDTSFDCNGNGIPDECDVGSFGTSIDCNENGIPDECETDCNANGVFDGCDIADGTSADCNGNGIPDECELDCDGNGVPDDCDLASGVHMDCNANGIPDVCDIASGLAEDCNENEILDHCEIEILQLESGVLMPIGAGMPQAYALDAPPLASSEVTIIVRIAGDFGAPVEYLDVLINGELQARLLEVDGEDCPDEPAEMELALSPDEYNAHLELGEVVLEFMTSGAVDPAPFICDSTLEVQIEYHTSTVIDLDGNGVPDVCECAADLTGDEVVNVFDLLALLSSWGVCEGGCQEKCDGDFVEDCVVNVFDLLYMLSGWGSCEPSPPE